MKNRSLLITLLFPLLLCGCPSQENRPERRLPQKQDFEQTVNKVEKADFKNYLSLTSNNKSDFLKKVRKSRDYSNISSITEYISNNKDQNIYAQNDYEEKYDNLYDNENDLLRSTSSEYTFNYEKRADQLYSDLETIRFDGYYYLVDDDKINVAETYSKTIQLNGSGSSLKDKAYSYFYFDFEILTPENLDALISDLKDTYDKGCEERIEYYFDHVGDDDILTAKYSYKGSNEILNNINDTISVMEYDIEYIVQMKGSDSFYSYKLYERADVTRTGKINSGVQYYDVIDQSDLELLLRENEQLKTSYIRQVSAEVSTEDIHIEMPDISSYRVESTN